MHFYAIMHGKAEKETPLSSDRGVSWINRSGAGEKSQAVLLVEFIHTAAGVDELLLAGVERMALGADFNGDVLLGAAGLDHGAARAANGRGLIIRVNSGLHDNILLDTKLP